MDWEQPVGTQKESLADVYSRIEQTEEEITLTASRIKLQGFITATDVGSSGSTTIYGNRISGGVITLGGNDNGNGQVVVKNASNVTTVTLSKDGITSTSLTATGYVNFNCSDTTCYLKFPLYGSVVNYLELSSARGFRVHTDTLSQTVGESDFEVLSNGMVYNWCTDTSFGSMDLAGGKMIVEELTARDLVSANYLGISYNAQINGNLQVAGTKNRAVKTKSFGKRSLSAFETASPMFADIGSGEIGDSGEVYVFVDPVFAETVNLDVEFHVLVQKYGNGECWVSEKNSSYFVVKGDPHVTFSWAIIAKQAGYDQDRLEFAEERFEESVSGLIANNLDEQNASYVNHYYMGV